MIWIKKVAATPLNAVAQVIDSFNTGDDKTTNAPSLRIVKNALDNKASNDDLLTATETIEGEIGDITENVSALTTAMPTKADKASMFIYRTYSTSIAIQPNSYLEVSAVNFNIEAITGYTPTGFRYIHTGSRNAVIYEQYARVSGTVLGLRNVSNSIVEGTAEVIIEFTRNDVRGA